MPFNLDTIDSLFVLSDDEQYISQQMQQYNLYFSLLHPKLASNIITISTMHDLTIYFYREHQLIVHPEASMIYVIRQFILDKVKALQKLELMKLKVAQHLDYSLLLSVKVTNVFADIFLKIAHHFSEEQLTLLQKYSHNTKLLFDEQFRHIESYPQKIIRLKTAVYQQMRQYIEQHEEAFENSMLQIIREVDEYMLIKRDVSIYLNRGDNFGTYA